MEKKHHFQFLDHIRGFAILAVFFHHCLGSGFGKGELGWNGWFRDFSASKSFLMLLPAMWGYAGVPVFFVVSGFCIHLSFMKGKLSDWRGFYLRRFFRLYPPYFFALLFFAFFFPVTRLFFDSRSDWLQFFSHLFLLHNLTNTSFFGIVSPFWTIATETQLYLIYPLLLVFVNRWGWKLSLYALFILEFSIRGAIGYFTSVQGNEFPLWIFGLPFTSWYSWSIGAALAQSTIEDKKVPFTVVPSFVWLLLAISTNLFKPFVSYSYLFFSLFTATIIANSLSKEATGKRNSIFWNHLRLLGTWSFSFYLLHQPIIALFSRIVSKIGLSKTHGLTNFLVCVLSYPLIALISMTYYKYCELPSIAMGKAVLKRKM